jgi:hypothetical protein
MKARGRTGKGYYREYYGVPAWFAKRFGNCGNGSLFNVANCKHYVGEGMDGKKKEWYSGFFLTDFEWGLPRWEREIAEADFIIHFGDKNDGV